MIMFFTYLLLLFGIGSRKPFFIINRFCIVYVSLNLTVGGEMMERNFLEYFLWILIIFLAIEFISIGISKEIKKMEENNEE